MLFVQLETGLPKTQVQLRKEHSNMSLPQSWNEDTFALLNVARVEKTEAPAVGQYQTARKEGIENVGGVWKEKWSVVDMFSDYTDDEGVTTTKAEQEAEYQARLDAKAADGVRTQRDAKLAKSDWMVIPLRRNRGSARFKLGDIPPSSAGYYRPRKFPVSYR
jgi:hypothetical protein